VAISQAAVMLVLLAITALAHSFINHSYHRECNLVLNTLSSAEQVIALMKYLPMSLATQKMASRDEKQGKYKRKDGQDEPDDDDGMDLFSRKGTFLFCIGKVVVNDLLSSHLESPETDQEVSAGVR